MQKLSFFITKKNVEMQFLINFICFKISHQWWDMADDAMCVLLHDLISYHLVMIISLDFSFTIILETAFCEMENTFSHDY